MLKLLTDEHIDPNLLRGLRSREPALDIIRVHDLGMLGTDDRDILARAATDGRILITHDRNTIPGFAMIESAPASQCRGSLFSTTVCPSAGPSTNC